MTSRLTSPRVFLLLLLAALTGWVFLLRGPTFDTPVWNVDEAIHASVARTLLDGGVLYRDAVDQRTPLTYYVFAAIFAVAGPNNLWAVHAVLAGVIVLTGAGLVLLARRAQTLGAGAWAAFIFVALSTNLLDPGDGNAAHTEWFAILFTTWGAWWFWRTIDAPGFRSALGAGVLFGLAFLSKQPALLDLAAPLLTVAWLAASRHWTLATAARVAAGLLGGFAAVTGATLVYFAFHGALRDLVFYTWTYNLRYYGPEATTVDRARSALRLLGLLWDAYPALLLAGATTAAVFAVILVQFRATPEERAGRSWGVYLLAWMAASLAGAAAGGRGFEHYYIQCLPPISLLAAWTLAAIGRLIRRWWDAEGGRLPRCLPAVGPAVLLVVVAAGLVFGPLAGRQRLGPPPDPALRAAAFIQAHTAPSDSIFVWGYNPDIYLYANRRPASRFVYCSFQTGLIPWTNLAPGKDTTYAIVPGAMNALLADLAAHRPAFIVDCSFGPHRHFEKYPLTQFAPLRDYVAANYVAADPAQFDPQGFRLYLIKDAARAHPVALAGGAPPSRLAAPEVFGPSMVEPAPADVFVVGEDPAGQLQRLELRADGAPVDAVSFPPTGKITLRFSVPFDRLGAGTHHLIARATAADGMQRESAPCDIQCDASSVAAARLPAFALPCVSTAITPLAVRAPFGPSAGWEDGHLGFFAHAPSALTYPLGPGASRVRGRFGFRPGAYAPDNAAPTDGAEFIVTWITPREERQVLFRRLLQPRDHLADRALQSFAADLPAGAAGGRIEFAITPGSSGNNACDWTYWADLELETSR